MAGVDGTGKLPVERCLRFEIPPLSFADYRRAATLIATDFRRSERRRRASRILPGLTVGVAAGSLALVIPYLDPFFSIAINISWAAGDVVLQGWQVLATATLLLLLGVIYATRVMWWRYNRSTKWFYEASRSFQVGYNLQICEDEIVSRSALGERRVPWDAVTKLVPSGDLWLLIVDTVSYYWIPNSLVHDPDAFRAFIEARIAPAMPAQDLERRVDRR